jgi:hypothetical protein
VFLAFCVGALAMAMLNGAPNNDFAAIAQFVVLAGASYALARIAVRKLIIEPRLRRRNAQRARGEMPDDEYEDVLVYPEREKHNR